MNIERDYANSCYIACNNIEIWNISMTSVIVYLAHPPSKPTLKPKQIIKKLQLSKTAVSTNNRFLQSV